MKNAGLRTRGRRFYCANSTCRVISDRKRQQRRTSTKYQSRTSQNLLPLPTIKQIGMSVVWHVQIIARFTDQRCQKRPPRPHCGTFALFDQRKKWNALTIKSKSIGKTSFATANEKLFSVFGNRNEQRMTNSIFLFKSFILGKMRFEKHRVFLFYILYFCFCEAKSKKLRT